MTSRCSRPKRSSEAGIASRRYFRFSVLRVFGPSWMPQKNFDVTT
jgi:hypothetical protein